MSEPFIAEVRIFPYSFAPRNWAWCNGQLLQISQNTALFSLIGTTFGGDGRTTFGLPELRGRASLSPGNGPGLTPRTWGQTGGTNTVTLTTAQIPGHTHTLRAANDRTNNEPDNHFLGARPVYQTDTSGLQPMASQELANSGGGLAHNNMQPYLAVNFCIALFGIYPSRS